MLSILSHPIIIGCTLVVGLVLLLKGADWLVCGASNLAKKLQINDLIIGMTIVAFGTSMPEFVVNIVSVANHSTDLAITNILGSNIINTLVIVGISALIYPCIVQKSLLRLDLPLNIAAGVMVLCCVICSLPMTSDFRGISRFGGMMLLLVFAVFLYFNLRSVSKQPANSTPPSVSIRKSIMWIVIGLICLVLGGMMIVKSATIIAQRLGVAEAIIGLTIVALGTSLPELATSAVAAFKHNSNIAIGNVVGSNIFNVFFILGASAIIRPLPAYSGLITDALLTAVSATCMWVLAVCNKQHTIHRWGGIILLLIYAAYLYYRICGI